MIFDNSESDSEAESDNETESDNEESLTQEGMSHVVSDVIDNQVQKIDGKFKISTN